MMSVLPTTLRVDVMGTIGLSDTISISQVVSETQLAMATWNSASFETLVVVTNTARSGGRALVFFREFGTKFGGEFERFGREKG